MTKSCASVRRKWLSVQIRKCRFFWEDFQKYYPGTPIRHIIPESFEGFHSREKLDHLVRGVHDLKDAAQRIRYIKRVRWVKGGGRRESESKNWMARYSRQYFHCVSKLS